MCAASSEVERPNILVIYDVPENLKVLTAALEQADYKVSVAPSGASGLQVAERGRPDLILLDIAMPEMHGFEVCRRLKAAEATRLIPVIFLTARDDTETLLAALRSGGLDYIAKPFVKEEVLARVRVHLENGRLLRVLAARNRELEAETARSARLTRERDGLAQLTFEEAERQGMPGFGGQTLAAILERVKLLGQAADIPVLITGESGVGKELVARAIHTSGPRRDGPFVAVNCSAVTAELAESLFFGHVKGAFTGVDRAGYFHLASGGTLFLDEIGDMTSPLQVLLLRVLEERRIRPVGSALTEAVDVRVVVATNVDLEKRAAAGQFRQDLYYRLARFRAEVPPLRQRREEIAPLARHFLEHFAAEMRLETPELTAAALQVLEAHDFPGNVRELRHAVEHALLHSQGRPIGPEHLGLNHGATSTPSTELEKGLENVPLGLERAQVVLARRALAQTDGNIAKAARLLGVHRNRLYRILAKDEHFEA